MCAWLSFGPAPVDRPHGDHAPKPIIMNTHALEHTTDLEEADLRSLMTMEVSSLLGGLIRLNQAERYHHRLNVFVLLAELQDLRRKAELEDGEGGRPVHRPHFPVRQEMRGQDRTMV